MSVCNSTVFQCPFFIFLLSAQSSFFFSLSLSLSWPFFPRFFRGLITGPGLNRIFGVRGRNSAFDFPRDTFAWFSLSASPRERPGFPHCSAHLQWRLQPTNKPTTMAATAPSGLACSRAPDHRGALVSSISLARASTSETHKSVEKKKKKEERERERERKGSRQFEFLTKHSQQPLSSPCFVWRSCSLEWKLVAKWGGGGGGGGGGEESGSTAPVSS